MVLERKIKVGDEVESRCTKCKKVTFHTVEAMDGEKILKVICKVCGSSHKYRSPKAKKKSLAEKKIIKKAMEDEKRWQNFISENEETEVKPYEINGIYEEGNLIEHPKFGKGYVLEIQGNKMIVVFKDGERKLIFKKK